MPVRDTTIRISTKTRPRKLSVSLDQSSLERSKNGRNMRPFPTDLSNLKYLLLPPVTLGIASGLTVGLIGLDYTTLEVLSKSGTPREQAAAKKILPIVNNHHLLLVTLLLMTASAEEAMPLFLERMMPAWASIIVSVILVLIFAEVVPMALCTRYGLEIGAKMAWLVRIFIWVASPIAYPISWVLDWLFGHSAGTLFKRSQLKELINMHSKHSIQTAADVEAELKKLPVEERLTSHEVQLIKNALDLNSRLAIEISTAIDDVYMLEVDQICDREVIGSIVHYGLHFSVPVYRENRDNIIGVIRVSDLISLSPDDNTPISELQLDPIPKIPSDTPVYHALTKLQLQKSQLCILVDPQLTRIPVAVLTLDDIVEELVEGQIYDYPLFPTSHENVLGEWLGGEDDDLQLEVASNTSAFSTASMPTRPRPSYIENSTHRNRSLNRDMAHLDAEIESRGRASSFSSNATVPFAVSSSSPPNASSSTLTVATRNVPFGTLSPQRATQYELDRASSQIGNDMMSRSGSIAPPSPSQTHYGLQPSSSSASLPVRPSTKLIPIPLTPQRDIETSSVGSDVFARYRMDSDSSVTSEYSAHTAPTDEFLSQAGSEASGTSASTAPAHLNINNRRRRTKDPNTAHQVDKKLNVASVVATALKRSTSSLSLTPLVLRPLPIIYKRNIQGEAVVDPSKLLSASYGDLPNFGDVNEVELPPIRTLSASHDDIGSPDEEQVALDW